MQGITLTGEKVRLLATTGNTVSDAKRVYIVWLQHNGQGDINEYELVTQMRLQDINQPFDEINNPYNVIVGSIYLTKYQPITLQKLPSDMLFTSIDSTKVWATPIFDRD